MAKAVAKKTTASAVAVPDYLKSKQMRGAGVSTDAADNLIPMARILQKMSPEVEKEGTQYIKGAEPGDIYIKNLPNSIIKGKEGILFQPCYFDKAYVEWLPRGKGGGGGGGYVDRHAAEPADTVTTTDPANPDRKVRTRKSNGNMIVETRYHGGFIIGKDGQPIPAVIPFASSGHTVSKSWMMMMNQKALDGHKADSWAAYYRLRSVLKTKNNNTWHLFEVTDAGPEDEDGFATTLWAPTEEDYARGEALHAALASGAKKFDDEPGPVDPDADPL